MNKNSSRCTRMPDFGSLPMGTVVTVTGKGYVEGEWFEPGEIYKIVAEKDSEGWVELERIGDWKRIKVSDLASPFFEVVS